MMLRGISQLVCLASLLVVGPGCTGPIFRPQSPDAVLEPSSAPSARLISDYTHPYGMNVAKVESVALVSGLAGTGSDPPPNAQRAELLDEMSRHDVDNPNQVLASRHTSLVLVRAYLRPGIQQGDRFDVEVRTPNQSETTSLRGGWLLPTRMSELALLGQQVRKGHDFAMAEGPVLVDPSADDNEPGLATRGRVLGGGMALKARPLGLIIANPHQSARLSQAIAQSINRRFHSYIDGRKQGVATAKTEEFIDLRVHPRYKDNITRYVRVVRSIALRQGTGDQQSRMTLLESQLADPLTAATAALRLEALGDERAVEVLKEGCGDRDPEVRFYSAEALAYLDDTEAVEPLAQAARSEPAFRVNALAALSAMDDVVAYDALRELLAVSSAETRYGAFRALWAMNDRDALIHGEEMNGQFSLHRLDVGGPSMIHATRSFRPEIVFFGTNHELQLPLVLDAGKNILVNGMSGGQITVSRFSAGQDPEQRVVSTNVEDMIRAIVDLGGTYPDVVQALQQAKQDGALTSRFAVDAIPQAGREYMRKNTGEESSSDRSYEIASPLPDLFSRRR